MKCVLCFLLLGPYFFHYEITNLSLFFSLVFQDASSTFYAPFFTTWFCSLGTLFIFPIYLIGMLLTGAKSSKIQTSFKDGIQGFRNKGITLGKNTQQCGKNNNSLSLEKYLVNSISSMIYQIIDFTEFLAKNHQSRIL